MQDKVQERQQAKSALAYIIPILEKYKFRWVITGGFACYVYGIDRLLTDIDIDIDTDKDIQEFKSFLEEVETYISQPLENFVDENYDNFNFELNYKLLVLLTAQATQATPTSDAYTEIKTEELPAAVAEALKKAYPEAVLNKASVNAKKEYQLEIKVGDKEGALYADESGNWIAK